ncbi:MAG: UvrD-helicase domain-containing protein [Gallionella sp.]|jgi:hypothetical protein|nr:UvrD-helicase domain-containing protein [Gallionella sp.]MCK9353733.1 UvrD-helicase domain-containing protein [Gallionella sp.]
MSSEDTFESPTVTDEDIYRASRLLGLPVNAFYGTDGADPRQNVLKCMNSVDVAACPGSGKTTLLVAKLAILAEKWQYRTRGICVLSHTNAARHEIEKHLGNTAAGRKLLGYPHYIGTIHGFVNEFLAIPWLRSRGYTIKMIDTDACHRRRWNSLPFNTRSALEQNHYGPSVLSIKTPDFGVGPIRWGKGGQLGTDTSTYVNIQKACQQSAIDGYFCYDEMFMWAGALIDTNPMVIDVLRDRFPILLIDEAQDNSKEQSEILSRIFTEGDNAVIRQRFGDANQAIFEFLGAEEAAIDKFPGASKMELPNSYRFGQTIANMADPLGLEPYGLQGIGPKKALSSGSPEGQHTIFLFDENSIAKVLDAYGELLLETFSDQELSEEWFIATAVGQVHKPKADDENPKLPKHLVHYWSDYDPELTKHDPAPHTFIQYISSGQGKSELKRETHAMVEKIAESFLRLSDFSTGAKSLARPKHQHRHILRLLETSPDICEQYQNLIVQFTVKQETPTAETWEGHWRGIVRSIAEVIAGSSLSKEADAFLMWNDTPVTPATSTEANKCRNNIFRYSKNGREVSIRAGSIHSVKGQTHTATLVLETYWYKHNLQLLLPWLTRKKTGWKIADKEHQKSRLKLHYVAMTRPTHLLCLALKKDALLDEQHLSAIQKNGWKLLHVQSDGSTVPPEHLKMYK